MKNYDGECQLPSRIRTDRLYVPERQTAEQMTVEHLKRGMCPKSRGDWHVCQSCPGGCSYGRRLVRVMTGEVQAPEETPKQIPARTLEMPRETSNRGRLSSEKRIAIAIDACRRVAKGESYASVAKSYGYSGTGLQKMIASLGIEAPEAETSNHARHKKRIERHVAMLEAIKGGMEKTAAARDVGLYPSWSRAKEYGIKYREEIAAAYHEKNRVSQAVAG